jgi:hypothetical protein
MAKKRKPNNIEKALGAMGDAPMIEPEIDIEIEEELPVEDDGVSIEIAEDGSATITMGEPEDEEKETKHYENLAKYVEASDLMNIGNEILAYFDSDIASREEWEKTYAEGFKNLGFQYEVRTKPFRGASGVTVPLLTEAVTQFSAQAMKELMPSDGPVRTAVIGASNRKREAQAQRVRDYMNYQITTVMKEYTPDFDQMLWYVGYGGSAFKKVYFDKAKKRCVSPFITPDNFVMPYHGSSNPWENERCIQVVPMSANELRKAQVSGVYLDLDMQAGTVNPRETQISDAEDKATGQTPGYKDEQYTLLEAHILYDVPGFEDKDGIKKPYIITVDKDSGKVLSIYRNWKEDDEECCPEQYYVHYMFLPGPGCMGYGLVHLIGNLNRAATSALRQLLDAGTLANLPAGFKARGLRIADDDQPLQPGEFRDVDAGGADLQSSLLPLPYKEPSQTLYTLMGFCIDSGRRLASIADMQVGDGNQQAAVGTTIALLEKGANVMSGIHKRMHYAQKLEFELLANCMAKHLPDEYPYEVEGGDRKVFKEDFDERIDVLPVADPNVHSSAQRIMMAQTQLQLAQSAPQMHNLYEAYRRMYEALGVRDIDMILNYDDTQEPKPKDPATENAEAIDGKKLKAFAGQQHDAHIVSHMLQGMSPIVQGNPLAATSLTKHILEHVRIKAEEQVEAQIFAEYGPENRGIVSDIQKEAMVAMLVAQGMGELRQLSSQLSGEGQPDPLVKLKEQELAQRAQADQAKIQSEQQKIGLQQQEMQQKAAIDTARIQSQEGIADQKANLTLMRLQQMEQQNAIKNRTQPQGRQ